MVSYNYDNNLYQMYVKYKTLEDIQKAMHCNDNINIR